MYFIKKIVYDIFGKKLNLKINSLISYLSQLVMVGSGFVTMYIINNYVSVEGYGVYTIILSSAGFIVNFFTARSGEAITKFQTREGHRKKDQNVKVVIQLGIITDIILAVLISLTIIGLSKFISVLFLKNQEYSELIALYSVVSFALFIRNVPIGYFQAKEFFAIVNVLTIAECIIRILLTVLLIKFSDASIKTVILANILSSTFLTLILYGLFLYSYGKKYGLNVVSINSSVSKEYIQFTFVNFLSTTLKSGSLNLDNLILAYLQNSKTVAYYQIFKKIASVVVFVTTPFTRLVFPEMVKLANDGKKIQMKKLIRKVNVKAILFFCMYLIISNLFLNSILSVFNIDPAEIKKLDFLIVSVTFVVMALQWWVKPFSNTINQMYSLTGNLLVIALQVSGVLFLTLHFALSGMIFGTFGLYLIMLIYWQILWIRFLKR